MNDRHEHSRPAFEEYAEERYILRKQPNTDNPRYCSTLAQHAWEAWCSALDYAAEQQYKQTTEHICAFHMDIMGTCFVCGSVNEEIRKAREEERLAQVEEGGPCPCCKGKLEYSQPENCSCHICPPCSQCTSTVLTCEDCGWEEGMEIEGK